MDIEQDLNRIIEPGRGFLVGSNVDHSLTKAFSESTESFLTAVQQLLDELETNFKRNEYGEQVWAPVEYVNCNRIASRSLKIMYGLDVARAINSDLLVFDRDSLLLLCKAFEYLDWKQRPTIVAAKEFIDPSRAVNLTNTAVEKLRVLQDLKGSKVDEQESTATNNGRQTNAEILPFSLQRCDVKQTLKRPNFQSVTIANVDYWNLMEALMAAAPNAVAEAKLQHLFPYPNDRKNNPKKLREIINTIGLTIGNWVLKECKP